MDCRPEERSDEGPREYVEHTCGTKFFGDEQKEFGPKRLKQHDCIEHLRDLLPMKRAQDDDPSWVPHRSPRKSLAGKHHVSRETVLAPVALRTETVNSENRVIGR